MQHRRADSHTQQIVSMVILVARCSCAGTMRRQPSALAFNDYSAGLPQHWSLVTFGYDRAGERIDYQCGFATGRMAQTELTSLNRRERFHPYSSFPRTPAAAPDPAPQTEHGSMCDHDHEHRRRRPSLNHLHLLP